MGTPLTDAEFAEMLAGFRRSWFKFEAQHTYVIGAERVPLERFLEAGEVSPPSGFGWWQDWLAQVSEHTRQGRLVQRVRVLDAPPTAYQRYLLAVGHWHAEAGERIRYLPRIQAAKLGFPLECDWSLFDGTTVTLTRFTPEGEIADRELITGAPVGAYRSMRDVALRYSTPARDIAAA